MSSLTSNHQKKPSENHEFDNVAEFDRVSPDLIEEARQFQSAVLCDVAGRRGALHARIQGLSSTMKLAGPAFPVEVRPGDNLLFHVALALAKGFIAQIGSCSGQAGARVN